MVHSRAFICTPLKLLSVFNGVRSAFSAIKGAAATFFLICNKVGEDFLAYLSDYISFNFVSFFWSKDNLLLLPL
jgi:hypothetical protein